MCRALVQAQGTQQKAKQRTPLPRWGPCWGLRSFSWEFSSRRADPGTLPHCTGDAALTNVKDTVRCLFTTAGGSVTLAPRAPWGPEPEVCPGKASRQEGSLAVATSRGHASAGVTWGGVEGGGQRSQVA